MKHEKTATFRPSMSAKTYSFSYERHPDDQTLQPADLELLQKARDITRKAYAPYSRFCVGAAAALQNGKIIYGTNQENAAYPVGICAERVLLSVAAMEHTDVPLLTMAVSYYNRANPESGNHPISPCGMCRQYIAEYEQRTAHPIRLILSGMEGEVYVVEKASQLLPFRFGSEDLG